MKKVAMICLALVLVFAMTVVAFAAAGVGDAENFSDNQANTQITVEVNTGNISATVPTAMTVVASTNGGELTCPSNYKITNTSLFAIKVDAQASADTNWALSSTSISTTPGSIPAPSNNKVGDIYMTFTPAGGSAWTLSETATTSGGFISSIAAASSGSSGTDVAISVAGNSSKLKTASKATNAVTVTYTIAAA